MKQKLKQTFAILLAAVMLLGTAPLGGKIGIPNFSLKASAEENTLAAEGQCGDNVIWSLDEAGILTISGTGAMWDYYGEESIAPYDKDSIKEIVFEDGVTSIGYGAFSSCENLESVDLGSVENLSDCAFAYCTKLTNVEFPDKELEIGFSAFEGCAKLDNIEFNDSVYIHGDAFIYCSGLTEIEIPEGSTVGDPDDIEGCIFCECTSLKKAVINGQIRNAQGLFINCRNLTDVEINTPYSLSWETFDGCTSLNLNLDEQDVDFGIAVNPFTSDSFSLNFICGIVCNVIYSGDIPSAPWGARTLNGYVNDEGLVFRDDTMTELTACPSCTRGEIFIPGSVAEIAAYAFVGCENLTDIYFDGTEAEWDEISISSEGNSAVFNAEIHFMKATGGECGDNLTWLLDEETGTLTISGTGDMWNYWAEESPFAFLPIETVIIESGVTSIGNNAFNPCEGITSITIPDGVTRIGSAAFGICAGLTSIELPDSVTSIGEYAFSCCESLTSIEIPYGITSIADYTFFSAGLTSVTIPDSITSIGEYAFASCSFENVVIPDSVTHIGNFAFCDCGSLKSITIGSDVTDIFGYAFDYCTELTDVYYNGTEAEWNNISINNEGNDYLFGATIHFKEAHVHSYTSTVTTEATCTEDGVITYTCECGDSYTETVKAEGHKLGSWYVAVEPTTTVCGILRRNCKNCDYCEEMEMGFAETDKVKSVALNSNKENLTLNSETQLTAVVSPETAGNKNIIWSSTDEDVATVDGGLVKAVGVGAAVIIAETEEGGYRDFCLVKVAGITASTGMTVIDSETNTIYGLAPNLTSLDGYVDVADENLSLEYSSETLGTGTTVNVVADGEVVDSYDVVIFGDTTGDSWYDGMDAMIVRCIANGMLSEDDIGEAAYMAADCNHDGVINDDDVELLEQAGLLLTEVGQDKDKSEQLETSSVYAEYVNLISQTIIDEDETVIPDDPAPVEPDTQKDSVNFFESFVSLIMRIIEMIKSVFDFTMFTK